MTGKECIGKCKAEPDKHQEFFNYVTNLFAEGVEFMTKDQMLDAIKKEWRRTLEHNAELTSGPPSPP